MGEEKIREADAAAEGARCPSLAELKAVRRVETARVILRLRAMWLRDGERGKWARFRMAWLLDKKLCRDSGYRAALGRNVQAIAEGADYV